MARRFRKYRQAARTLVCAFAISGCASTGSPAPPSSVARIDAAQSPLLPGDGDGFQELWRAADHRDKQVCRYRRVACRISERVPGFGQPDSLGRIQVASEKPAEAVVAIARAREATVRCLRRTGGGGGSVRYRVWVAPSGRVSKVTATRVGNLSAAACATRLRYRAYPSFHCGYGFEVSVVALGLSQG